MGESPATLEDADADTVFASGCRGGFPAPPRMNGCMVERPNTEASAAIGLENVNPSQEARWGRVLEAARPGFMKSPSMEGFGRGDPAVLRWETVRRIVVVFLRAGVFMFGAGVEKRFRGSLSWRVW